MAPALCGFCGKSICERRGVEPLNWLTPPPLKRWSAPLVHMARAPDKRFRVGARCRRWGLSGLFLGTYSPLPYAAPCRRSPRTWPVRCGFATEPSGVELVQRPALVQPYVPALINREARRDAAISISAEIYDRERLSGKAATSMAVRASVPASTPWRRRRNSEAGSARDRVPPNTVLRAERVTSSRTDARRRSKAGALATTGSPGLSIDATLELAV